MEGYFLKAFKKSVKNKSWTNKPRLLHVTNWISHVLLITAIEVNLLWNVGQVTADK